MQLLLISTSMLIASWLVMILSLYFAIRYKEVNRVKKSKFFYFTTILGEMLAGFSWYLMIISIVLMVVKLFN